MSPQVRRRANPTEFDIAMDDTTIDGSSKIAMNNYQSAAKLRMKKQSVDSVMLQQHQHLSINTNTDE